MVKGLGVDIVEVERMKKALDRHQQLYDRLFTSKEKEYCSAKVKPYRHYALRFAAKEAVLKSLGTGLRGVKWTDIEINHDVLGKPQVTLTGNAAKKACDLGVDEILVSLSFSRENAVASAVSLQRNGINKEMQCESS